LPRMPALDGLRAIAVIAVVVAHSFVTAGNPRLEVLDQSVNMTLRVVVPYAIDLFFVISGYLITAILYETRNSINPLRTFYARRALRIVPLYYLYLFLTRLLFFTAPPEAFGTAGPLSELLFLTNVSLIKGINAAGGLNAHFWTLSIEEQFYILWPLAVVLAPLKRLAQICCFLILASFATRFYITWNGQWGGVGWFLTPTRLDGLIAGGLVAVLQRQNHELLQRWAKKVFALMAALVLPAMMLAVGYGLWRVHGPLLDTMMTKYRARKIEIVFQPFVAAILFASATALLVMKNSGRERFLTAPWLLSVAEASYGMYVFHIPIVGLLYIFLFKRIPLQFGLTRQLGLAITTVIVSYYAGHWTWRLYEKRFVKMGPRYRYASVPDQLEAQRLSA
jgi:peptidoglycan/LPS O-acetylase OafA/YrhL